MKRIFTSAGAVGVGILGLCNVDAQEAKPWSLKAKLRSFYDDNYGTLNAANPAKDDSFGFEINPVGSFQGEEGPTQYQVEYDYRMRFFEGRGDNQFDNQHKVSLNLANQFTDNWKLGLQNTFAFAQEPGVNEQVITAPVKSQGSYIRNRVGVKLTGQLSEIFGAEVTLQNVVSDFQSDGIGSRSALLDRMDNMLQLRGTRQLRDETVGSVGYAVGYDQSISDDAIANIASGAARTISSDERDTLYQRLFFGMEHKFTDVLSAKGDLGVEFASFPNAVAGVSDNAVNPYVNAKVVYALGAEGTAEVGVRVKRSGTDVAFLPGNTNPTLDSLSTSVFGAVESPIVGPLSGRLVFQIQNSDFKGGLADNSADNLYTGGLTFTYDIFEGLAAETGYALDRLDSDLSARGFVRHRGFVGLNYSY
jgi:hypothetical protein